jgi:hypothetical protein
MDGLRRLLSEVSRRERLYRAFTPLHQRERRDHDAARLAHRSYRLQTRSSGGDRVVDHGGLQSRPECAFDYLLQAVLLGFLAHEEAAQVGAVAMRRRHHRVCHR